MNDDNIRYLPLLHISQATRAFGMTPRALRFYEEFGLIEAQRDDRNRRFYDAAARRRLRWIGELRSAGLALRDIQAVIEADESGRGGETVALERLQTRRSALESELAGVDDVIARFSRPSPAALPAAE